MDYRTRRLTYLGLLIALAVVLTRYASVRLPIAGVENIRIGFGHFPIIMAGVLYGPIAGAGAGALADLIGFALSPMGVYMPHFTVASALTGLLPGVLLSVWRPQGAGVPSFARLLVSIALTQLLIAVVLTSYALWLLFGHPFAFTLVTRLVTQAFLVPLYASVMHLVFRSVNGLAPTWERSAFAREVAAAKD
ncbi:MAG: folate family ECF transporter S component [Bacillota bacterium]|nr:MAG: folate family ECF transporter S component [Bacillota bacterium]